MRSAVFWLLVVLSLGCYHVQSVAVKWPPVFFQGPWASQIVDGIRCQSASFYSHFCDHPKDSWPKWRWGQGCRFFMGFHSPRLTWLRPLAVECQVCQWQKSTLSFWYSIIPCRTLVNSTLVTSWLHRTTSIVWGSAFCFLWNRHLWIWIWLHPVHSASSQTRI